MNTNIKRIPLAGVYNVRDLGGYQADGGITKWGVYLRSAAMDNITDQDAAFLYQYGIRTVIDLRTASEFKKNNTEYLINTLASNKIIHRHIPVIDNYDDITKHFYIHMVENAGDSFRQIFEYIAERLCLGGILYNCFMGRDRTGVLSALLLMLCGVSEDDILADYMVSSIYLRPLAKKLSLSDDFISSRPEYMEEFLQYFKKHYINAEQYLLSIGVLKDAISAIKEKFIYVT